MTITQATNDEGSNRRITRRQWLRTTLRRSQQEAIASSAMTATSDNFFHAFAIFLQASMAQMGWITGLPQLFGAVAQIASLKLGCLCQRKSIIVIGAFVQATGLLAMSALALVSLQYAVWLFIALTILHHGLLNLIQPQWRAWMGNIVPPRRRGAFFAARTRITMSASLAVFIGGGLLLSYSDNKGYAGIGFSGLFLVAAIGRYISGFLLFKMHDPLGQHPDKSANKTFQRLRQTFGNHHFRQYCLFVAGMQAMVAISAPFFAVYMLTDLQFSYWEFVLASVTSIVLQFVSLRFWGLCCDTYGNRTVMVITCSIIPLLPILWLFSGNLYYILLIQAISGISWSGFTLASANFIYDLRPQHSDFTANAVVQAGLSAALVFVGAIAGGFIATHADDISHFLHIHEWLISPLFIVFMVSSLGRIAVATWFIHFTQSDTQIGHRGNVVQLILRVARFNAISGVTFDWLTTIKKSDKSD